MARAADQFRQSDVVKWGAAAAAAAFLALICANVAALVPDRSFAVLHNSRAVNQETAELNAEVAALNGSKANLLTLAAAQQQLQRTGEQLSARLDGIEKTATSDRGRLGTLEATLPRLVNTLPISGTDASLITGSIGNPTPGFKTQTEPPPVPTAAPAAAPAAAAPLTAAPSAAAPIAAPPVATAEAPEPAQPSDRTGPPFGAIVAGPPPTSTLPSPGPQWSEITSLPVFTTPDTTAPATDVALIAPAENDAPFPMAPRATANPRAVPTPPPVALAPAPPQAHPDVKAIGVAIGGPMQPSDALAGWQQIAERVGVMLVGMSPLLADDPAGSPGKVLVAGPVASIAVATKLCAAIDHSGLNCTPMPYVGAELAPAAGQ